MRESFYFLPSVLKKLFLDEILTSSMSVFFNLIKQILNFCNSTTAGSLDRGQYYLYAGCQFSCVV